MRTVIEVHASRDGRLAIVLVEHHPILDGADERRVSAHRLEFTRAEALTLVAQLAAALARRERGAATAEAAGATEEAGS